MALALLNRLDTALLYAPAMLWLPLARRVRWGHHLPGALPLLAWFAFSLFYYGFLFPNPKYAKLDTGLALSLYLEHGLHYSR